MAIRKKLYYDVSALITSVATTGDFNKIISSGISTATPDRYGNLIEANAVRAPGDPASAYGSNLPDASAESRALQAIGAWFVCSSWGSANTTFQQCIKFFNAETGVEIHDPTSAKFVLVRIVGQAGQAGTLVKGTLYVQRQHSIEV